jgi:glutamyl/glutaminyl-tRNA synthetase
VADDSATLRYAIRGPDSQPSIEGTLTVHLQLDPASIRFDDLRLGRQVQRPAEQCGDLLARDRDGHWTYQFAVVVDDLPAACEWILANHRQD